MVSLLFYGWEASEHIFSGRGVTSHIQQGLEDRVKEENWNWGVRFPRTQNRKQLSPSIAPARPPPNPLTQPRNERDGREREGADLFQTLTDRRP